MWIGLSNDPDTKHHKEQLVTIHLCLDKKKYSKVFILAANLYRLQILVIIRFDY